MQSPEVLINPRKHGHGGNTKPTKGQEPTDDNEEEPTNRDPYGARYDDQRREEDETEDRHCDGCPREEEENGAGYYEGQEPQKLS